MEAIIFIALIAIIIIVVVNFSSISNKLDRNDDELLEIKKLLKIFTEKQKEEKIIPEKSVEIDKPLQPKELKIENRIEIEDPVTHGIQKKEIFEKESEIKEAKTVEPAYLAANAKESEIAKIKKEPSLFEQDLEKFVGENLISKIGIIILVLGVGYFVKYAIDKDWINEYGRVAIGILAGGILIAVAHYLRKNFKTFSSILTGGGLAVLYTTITIGYHQYLILSQTAALSVMVLITVFSVALSLIYDKKELAIFSQLGGYASPFLVSTGEGNFIGLFVYILILNAGLLVLAYYKRWNILNLIAYLFTLILFGSWVFSGFKNHGVPIYTSAFIFASLFYLVFFMVNIINNIKERQSLNSKEIGIILSNNLFYLLAGLFILNKSALTDYKGLFPVVIGIFNFSWLVFLYKRQNIDKTLIYLLIGLVMSFISIAIPIQLKGNSITLFWSAEIVILLWLAQKSGIKLLKAGHFLILILSVISIFMDWTNMYDSALKFPVIINKFFITGLVLCAAMFISKMLMKNEKELDFVTGFEVKIYRNFLLAAFIVITYLVLFIELNYQMNRFYSYSIFRYSIYTVFNSAFLAVLLLLDFYKNDKKFLNSLSSIIILAIFIFTIVIYFQNIGLRNMYLSGMSVSLGNFLFHYLYYPFIAVIIVLLGITDCFKTYKITVWIMVVLVVSIISAETDNIVLLINGTSIHEVSSVLSKVHKAGYPVLWAIMAFILMLWGMRKKNKELRIISLSLLGLIILKLLAIDVWQMSQGGRIISFIFVGLVLLVVSFLYQKLKQLLVDDNNEISE